MKKRLKKNISFTKKTLVKIANPKKLAILTELKRRGEINQLELKKHLKFSYKSTRTYIKKLEKSKLVKTRKSGNKLGSPIFVRFNREWNGSKKK